MKRITIIMLLCGMILITGCTNVNNKNSNTEVQNTASNNNSYDISSMDYMEKYINNLPNNSARNDFLSFWQYSIAYAKAIKLELKEISNTNSYTFDPTNSSEIPDSIRDIYDYSSIKRKPGFETHKNFKLVINGTDVKLSYDGIEFYPTDYSYTDVQELVEKYNE